MKNLFPKALIAQTLCLILFLIHRFTYYSLGSNLMFGVDIISFIVGCYLLWNVFTNRNLSTFQKIAGVFLGILPFLGIAFMIYFVTNFKMH